MRCQAHVWLCLTAAQLPPLRLTLPSRIPPMFVGARPHRLAELAQSPAQAAKKAAKAERKAAAIAKAEALKAQPKDAAPTSVRHRSAAVTQG